MRHDNNQEILELMYALSAGRRYHPPSHTCIKEFTPSFPKPATKAFEADTILTAPEWVPEPPYPKIYTDNYKKSLLSTL